MATPTKKRAKKRTKSMPTKFKSFDVSEYLNSEERIAEYLSQVFADGDTDEMLQAIGDVAKARGMAEIAKKSGLGRESLYKAFGDHASPRFDTVNRVMKALNLRITAVPAP